MYKYEYQGKGTITFWVDEKPYIVKKGTQVELPKKVDVVGLKIVEEEVKSSKIKNIKEVE